MRCINILITILIFTIIGGCSYELDYYAASIIFIEDDDNPQLPIYSEKGYNSFGIYWGLSPLVTKHQHDPSKIVSKNDSCHIYLSGTVEYTPYTVIISIPEYSPESFNELIQLNNKEYNLSLLECNLSLLSGSSKIELELMDGLFKIHKAQNMYIDKKINSVVLSGKFWFKAVIDDEPISFSNGRFDIRYGDDNFFFLP